MKTRPEIILNKKDKITYNKILITGSDESLINYVRDYIIKNFRSRNYFIDLSGNYNKGIVGDLFSDKKVLFLLKQYSSKEENLKSIDFTNQCILIASPNGKKINIIKKDFSESKDSLVIECYPLSRKSKELILLQNIDNKHVQLSNDVFWYIIENFENQYVLFLKQLETLSLLQTKIDSIDIVERAVFVNNKIDLSKIIFHIFKNNTHLINVFNKNIYSQTDFYIFLNSLKKYIEIIASSKTKDLALLKFPKYLFGEKDVFIKIYNLFNKIKILEIYKKISKVEVLIRKNPSLYNVIGLRFLLNIKKIIIS